MGQDLPSTREPLPESPKKPARAIAHGALLAFLVLLSRLFFEEIGTLAYIYLPHAWVDAPQGEIPPHGGLWFQSLFGIWAHWDGYWYLSIAQFGYQGRTASSAFFPLYPWLMHLLGSSIWAGLGISLVAFTVSVVVLYLWVSDQWGPAVAWLAVLVYAFFPTGFYLNAVYTEALYTALAFSTLYAAQKRRYWWAFVLAALATLTSIYGILLSLSLFVLVWKQERRFWRAVGFSIGSALGLLVYMAFLTWRFHDPLMFQSVQSDWGRHFAWPWVTLVTAFHAAWANRQVVWNYPYLFSPGPAQGPVINFYNLIFMVGSLIVLVVYGWRLPLYLWAYLAPALAVTLFFPAYNQPLMSFPRLIFENFPILLVLAIALARRPWWRFAYWSVCLYLGALLTALFATAHWVA
ncbi:glycosyltransferase family 39 protein [Sulfobacillus sp. hq2]|uniref:glycosyltransferase family 39 protein n=1 Tax=Sulfobacillus TaxID=28033 RepID=UPI0013047CCA|nr:glycosyltransferase family 39 protein [Sulfobacillus sp. hq2]